MSFFDDDEPDDRPTRARRAAPPRRPTPPRPATTGGPRRPTGGAPDPQTARVRQAVALGIGILILILFVVGIRGCVDSRRERALKDYNRDVTALIENSQQVSSQLFEALAGGASGDDLEVALNQLRLDADEHVERSENLEIPDEMKPAHRNLELVLNLRAEGVEEIGAQLGGATSDNEATATQAVQRIAGQMKGFLASDVVYSQRVQPLIEQALSDEGIGGQTIADSEFLPSLGWLDPDEIAKRVGAESARTSGGSSDPDEVAPGLHGHGLLSVAVGATTLQPGESVNRIPAGAGLAFKVTFANQGDNDEQDVNVTVTVRGAGNIRKRRRVAVTRSKQNAEVNIPLDTAPPIGRPVRIEVVVEKVPGETKTDNNRQTYTAIFTR